MKSDASCSPLSPFRLSLLRSTSFLHLPVLNQVRAAAGVHAGGGRGVHVPVRGPVRPPLRCK